MDSIALTYSLMDPVMTVLRPVTAFFTALVAGVAENVTTRSYEESQETIPDRTCLVDGCCDGIDCDPRDHARHHSFGEKLLAGIRFALDELLEDLATWFLIGIVLAGIIAVLVPETFVTAALGTGIFSYLVMLVAGMPLYVCATMSTPIAAALVVKGLSPGAALVFLVAGPATNVATMTMVGGILGRRTLGIYLGSILICTLIMGFVTDAVYGLVGISAAAQAGVHAGELIPYWLELGAAIVLICLIVRVFGRKISARLSARRQTLPSSAVEDKVPACGCGESGSGST